MVCKVSVIAVLRSLDFGRGFTESHQLSILDDQRPATLNATTAPSTPSNRPRYIGIFTYHHSFRVMTRAKRSRLPPRAIGRRSTHRNPVSLLLRALDAQPSLGKIRLSFELGSLPSRTRGKA